MVTDAYDARGVHTTFAYDDLNRVETISYSDSTPTAHYHYDDAATLPSGAPSSSSPDSFSTTLSKGRLVAMTYGSGPTGNYFDYDVAGRVTKQFQITGSTPAKYKLSYAYNLAGLLTSETYPSGRALSYSYDEGGRLATVGDGTTTFAGSFSYAAHGGLASETFGNAMVHALEYNRRLQANKVKLSQTVSSTTTVLQQYDYGYGAFNTSTGDIDTSKNNGQIGKIAGSINGDAKWNQGFSFDELGRLKNVIEHTGSAMGTENYSQGYTYDRFGNRFQEANTPLGLPAVSSSEITAATNRFNISGTTYDAAGNITTDTKFRSLKYQYDANGRQSAVKQLDDTSVQTSVYDCAGQRVQTTEGGTTRTMVYDVFGQNIADYVGSSGATLERENIYRGGQLLATAEIRTAWTPTGLAATSASGSVTLNWTAATGAGHYKVERKAAGGSFSSLTTTTSTSTPDSGASTGSAYLYRVCAADGSGNCTSAYSNVVLGAPLNFTTDPTITTIADDPTGATVTVMQAAHITQLRTAIDAVRVLAGIGVATWPHSGLHTGDTIYKEDVSDLRTKLDEALDAMSLRKSKWVDDPLAGGSNGTLIRGVHITQVRQCATTGSSCYKSVEQFVKDFYQGALHRQPSTGSSGELASWTETLGLAQSQGTSQLRAAAQSLGSTLFNSSEYAGLGTSDTQFVTDLYAGYLQRAQDLSGAAYWLGVLHTSPNTRANLIAAFAAPGEFTNNVEARCTAPATGGGIRYVLTDAQGSTRALMNNNGSSSAVIARHDYLPFGEEISSGIGLRSSSQGYSAIDNNRWKYGMLQRDAATGLDHAGWRKYESFSGRWTSPDPLHGSIADPQSFNHYTYAANDPVNFADPSGLDIHDGVHIDPHPGIGPPPSYVTVHGSDGNVDSGVSGGDMIMFVEGKGLPQNHGTPLNNTEIGQLRSAAAELLADKTCGNFIKAVLDQLGVNTGRKAFSSNALDIFDEVKKQGGIGRRALSDTAEGGSTVGNKDAFINISFYIGNTAHGRADAGRSVLHELLHVGSSTNQNYDHYEMFKAAYTVAERLGGFNLGDKPGNTNPRGRDEPNAFNFDRLLFQACHVR